MSPTAAIGAWLATLYLVLVAVAFLCGWGSHPVSRVLLIGAAVVSIGIAVGVIGRVIP